MDSSSNWFVDYVIPVITVAGVALATMFGSYWAKKREFRSLDSMNRKDNIYVPLAKTFRKILDTKTATPIPIIIDKDYKLKKDIDSMDLSELFEYNSPPKLYYIPIDVLGPLRLLLSNIEQYMLAYEKVISEVKSIATSKYTRVIEKLIIINNKNINIDFARKVGLDFIANKSTFILKSILRNVEFNSFISSIMYNNGEYEKVLETSNMDEFIKAKEKELKVKGNEKDTLQKQLTIAYITLELSDDFDMFSKEIMDYILSIGLYRLYGEALSVKSLLGIIEGKIYHIRHYYFQ